MLHAGADIELKTVTRTRFETYGIALPPELRPHAEAMKASAAVTRWRELALQPAIPIYDD